MHPLRWIRKLYDHVLLWAEHPHGVKALCGFAAIEAIFFPIPVDPILLAMGAAQPRKALFYGVLTTLSSVAGAGVGYYIGYMFWESTQGYFYAHLFSQSTFEHVIQLFKDNAFMAIFLAGLTPIPYKVFAIAGGVAHVGLVPFFFGSLLGRSLRFVTIGTLLFFFGPQVRVFVEKHFERITIATGLLVVLIFALYKFLI